MVLVELDQKDPARGGPVDAPTGLGAAPVPPAMVNASTSCAARVGAGQSGKEPPATAVGGFDV